MNPSKKWILPELTDMPLHGIESNAMLSHLSPAELVHRVNTINTQAPQGEMYMRLFYLFSILEQPALALSMQAKALAHQVVYRIHDPQPAAVRLLVLMGAGDNQDNMPVDYVVDGSDIRVDIWYVSPDPHLPQYLPEHDIALVALGESQKNRPILEKIARLLEHWPRPFLNHPASISLCARDTLAQRLSGMPGIRVAATRQYQRHALPEIAFPVTLRPLDTHAGRGLEKITQHQDLQSYLDRYASVDDFSMAEFIDYRSADGQYRKYRIALIDRVPYICHLAIGDDWLLHYQTADMEHHEQKRMEEQQVMAHFDTGFAIRHRAAFEAVSDQIGLDYAVIDCAETSAGELLIFEVDNGGWIHARDRRDIFPYKPAVMQKAFDAFRRMLLRKSALSNDLAADFSAD